MARKRNAARIVSLLLWLLSPTIGAAESPSDFGEVVYHTCYDGDTCMVSLPGIHALFGDHILFGLRALTPQRLRASVNVKRYWLRKRGITSVAN